MQAGKLRHRVELQRSSVTANSHGDQVATWSTLATVWAEVQDLTVNQRTQLPVTLSEATVQVRMRGYPGIALTAKDRVRYVDPARGERLFDILGVINFGGRNVEWRIPCREHFG